MALLRPHLLPTLLVAVATLAASACASNRATIGAASGSAPLGINLPAASADGPAGKPVAPSPIALSDIPRGPSAKSMADPGDRKRRLRPPSPGLSVEEADALREAASRQPPDANIQVSRPIMRLDALVPAPLEVLVNRDAMDVSECCDNNNTATVPPDPETAAGPGHVVVVVNTAFEVFNRAGASIAGPFEFDAFFAGVNGCTGTFDPNVLYDEVADRFFVGVDGGGGFYCFAVTSTNDPTGTWTRYSFDTTNAGEFFDFPHVGIGTQAIFMGANMFNSAGTAFLGSRVWAINKAAAYAGGPLPVPVQRTTGFESTPQPIDIKGSVTPPPNTHYILTDNDFDGNVYSMWTWVDPFGANTFTRTGEFDLEAASGVLGEFPIDQVQFGAAAQIQANDWRVQDADYRNGRIWMAHNMSCNPGSGPTNCARWAELDPATVTVVQSGVLSVFGQSLSFGNVAVNERGDMILGFTATGPTRIPGVYVAGRLANDPPGFLRDPILIKAGETPYQSFEGSPFRWGDYTEATTDPDGETFWYIGQFSKVTTNAFSDWGTQIAQLGFVVPDELLTDGFENAVPPPPPPPPPPVTAAVRIEMLANLEDADDPPGVSVFEGDNLALRYIVYNDGTARLTNIVVTDPVSGVVTCPSNTLDPGADMLCTDSTSLAIGGGPAVTRAASVSARQAGTSTVLGDTDSVVYVVVAPPGTTCVASGGTNCPAPIPDGIAGGGNGPPLLSTITIAGCTSVTDANIGMVATHTFVGDLRVELTGPTGVTRILLNAPLNGSGSCSRDNVNVVFDDEGSAGAANNTCLTTGTFAITGNRTPVQPLNAFDTLTGNGVWTLRVIDTFGLDVGVLRNWSLQLSCN